MEAGVQSVMTLGRFVMPLLPVGSLAIVEVKYVATAAPRGPEYG